MFDLKVKTLEGGDYSFSVEDETTLGEFRQKVTEKIGVASECQRLIFHGKVLQDDSKKLSDFNVGGKVLHLVARPPPGQQRPAAPLAPHPDEMPTHEHRNVIMGNFPVVLHNNLSPAEIETLVRQALERLGEIGRNAEVNTTNRGETLELRVRLRSTSQQEVDSPARGRLEHVRTVLRHINHILYHIERDSIPSLTEAMANRTEGAPSKQPDIQRAPGPQRAASERHDQTDQIEREMAPLVGDCLDRSHELISGEQNIETVKKAEESPNQQTTASASNSTERTNAAQADQPRNIRHSSVSEFMELFQQMLQVQDRARPAMDRYGVLLRDERAYEHNSSEGREMARFFNGVQVVMHNLSHVYHALSDINIHFCETPPRNVYPQYASIDFGEPAEAEIAITFESSGNRPSAAAQATASQTTATGTTPVNTTSTSTPSSRPGGSIFSGFPPSMPMPPGFPPSGFLPHGLGAALGARVRMEIGPDGNMRIISTTTSGDLNNTSTSTPITVSHTQGTNVVYSTSGGLSGSIQNPQMNQVPGELFQQLMQGVVAATTGMNIASPVNAAQSQSPLNTGQQQPGVQFQVPTGSSPSTGPATGLAAGRVPPFGFPTAQAIGGIRMARGRGRGRGRRARGSRMFVGRSAIPVGQRSQFAGQAVPLSGEDQATLDHLNDSMASSAIFMGPRPPTELPLYTLDPYLPCASRHFDPRNISRRITRNRRLRQEQQTQTRTEETEVESASAEEETEESNSEHEHTNGIESIAGASFRNDDEFVATLEQMLRSVIANMNGDESPNVDSDDTQQIYAFQPVMQSVTQAVPVITGTVTMEARPVTQQNQAPNAETNTAQQTDAQPAGAQGGLSVRDIFSNVMHNVASGSEQTIGEFVRGLGENLDADFPGFVGELMRVMTETLSVRELITLMNDNTSPLDRARTHIRRFLIDDVLNGNDRPSDEDLRSAARRLAANPESIRQLLSSNPDEREIKDKDGRPIDIIASVINCEEISLENTLRLIFGHDPVPADDDGHQPSFGQALNSLLWTHLRQVVFLINMAQGEDNGYEGVLRRYFANLRSEGLSEELSNFVTNHGIETFRQSLALGNLTENDVAQYFLYKPEKIPIAEPVEQESKQEEFVDTTEVLPEAEPGNVESVATQPEIVETEVGWKRALPEEWVKVIEEDIEKQKNEVQQRPFSDAYINGMPPKRRRMVIDQRPQVYGSNMDSLLVDSLTQAVQEAGVRPITGEQTEDLIDAANLNPALASAYRKELDSQVQRRLQSDPDFDAKRFPKSKEHFKP